METVKSVLNVIVAAAQTYPEATLILWGVSLLGVIVMMWG